MRTITLLLALLVSAGARAQLVLNELSQGRTSSQKEYFEFVVAGTRTCTDSTLDLRGWIFDDNNGWIATGSGTGIATGAMRFANVANWSKVPYGSIILVYSDIEKNNSITLPDDPTDANHDYVYVLRANSTLLEKNLSDPSSPSSASFTYTTTGWSAGGDWSTVALANGGDGVVIVKPTVLNNEVFSFGFVIGSAATATVWVPDMPGGKNYSLTDANYSTAASWVQGDADVNETPGAPNGGANTAWINGMRVQATGVTVNPISSTNGNTLCTGATTTLSSTTPGGAWTTSNAGVATIASSGLVTAVAPGTATLTYTVVSGACTATATFSVTVTAAANAGTVSGGPALCSGQTTTYISNGTAGGTWSSGNPLVASVNAATGVVTGVSAGSTTIIYSVGSGTCASSSNAPVTVTQTPVVAATTGNGTVCTAATTQLTNATAGGTWSSDNGAIATVNAAGLVTGVAAGSTVINYIVTNGTCSTTVPFAITVAATPNAGTVTGGPAVCVGASVPYASNGAAGGVFTSSNTAVATVNATTGVATGVAAGTANIVYTVSSGTCTAQASAPITVNAAPVLQPTTGNNLVCSGGQVTLTNPAISGSGTWSSSNPALVTLQPSLVAGGPSQVFVTAISAGTVVINFTVTVNGCSTTVPFNLTINATPVVAPVLGGTALCSGATTTLTDATPGGTWTSNNTAAATVNPVTGLVTGIATGAATITYTVSNGGCTGTATTTINVTTTPAPSPIGGSTTICAGATTTLTNTLAGGTWTSSVPGVATVNATSGLVTGVSAGTSQITYTVTNNGCTGTQTTTVTINAAPVLTAIADKDLCIGSTTTLTPSVTGGTWTSSNTAAATVTNAGVVTALAVGTSQLTYTVSSGSCSASQIVNISVQDLVMQLTASPNPAQAGQTVTLTSSGSIPHAITAWGPASAFANQTAITQTITAAASATYFVVGRSSGGCVDTAFVNLVVTNTIDDLFVPNYFTPNADGRNDILYLYGSSVAALDFRIFNQWGEQVFSSTDKGKGWDGTMSGKQQPVGVYMYVAKVTLIGGAQRTLKGSINLIR